MSALQNDGSATNCHKYIDAIRAGGFVCLLPQVIDPSWGGYASLLAGFPLNVSFTGLAAQSGNCRNPVLVMASYWFDPASYREDDRVRAMSYFANPPSGYRVELIYWKEKQQWEGRKYRAGDVLFTSNGSTLPPFIIQLTLGGIWPDEPSGAVTREAIGGTEIFVFAPETNASKPQLMSL